MFRKQMIFIFLLLPVFSLGQEIDLLLLNREYKQALQQIEERLAVRPQSDLYFKKGLALEKLLKFEDAIAALELACASDSVNPVYWEELAEAHSSLGNYMDAIACFQQAIGLDGQNLTLQGKLAKSYINLKAYADAYAYYQRINFQDSTNSYFNRYFAYAAYRTNRLEEAASLYEKLLQQGTRDLSVYLNLATIYSKQENMNGAVRACFYGERIFPDHPALVLKRADTYFLFKDYAKAQHPYERYLAANDSTFDVLKNYGICLYFTKFEEEAVSLLEQCYEITVNDPIVNFYIGACHKKLKHLHESIAFFKLSIETATPSYLAEIYHHMGQVYGWQREFKASIEAYDEAMKLDPDKVELLFEIATTYEEYNFNKTLALNYYRTYLLEAGEAAENADYALDRIKRIKEELFFEE